MYLVTQGIGFEFYLVFVYISIATQQTKNKGML
jgi:hypothetical protein